MNPPPTGSGDGSAAMASLARLAARLDETTGAVAEVTERVTATESGVTQLAARVKKLEKAPKPAKERAPWWPDLSLLEAELEWEKLGEWVETTLLPRLPGKYLRNIRPCWRRHPAVVDELAALRAAWYDAYKGPSSLDAAAYYLERWLPGAMARIAEHLGSGCTTGAGGHQDPDTSPPTPWTDQELREFLSEDLADRPESSR